MHPTIHWAIAHPFEFHWFTTVEPLIYPPQCSMIIHERAYFFSDEYHLCRDFSEIVL